jgi:hypothetical protein
MTTTLNASTAGAGGFIATSDNSGVLALQTAGTTAVTIDTNQRAAFVAGTAALPAITTTGDTNTGIFFPAADTIAFSEGGTESVRIDSSGNVGIGTTSPAKKLQVNSADTTDGIRLYCSDSGGENLSIVWQSAFGSNRITGDIKSNASGAGGNFILRTANTSAVMTEALRVDNAQNLLVGLTAQRVTEKFNATATSAESRDDVAVIENLSNTTGKNGLRVFIGSGGNNTSTWHFRGETRGVGNSYLYGNGTTSYSSDSRLKKNIVTTRNGYLEDLNKLRVVKYQWIGDNPNCQQVELGLIAQEVEEVFPNLVQEHEIEGVGMRKNIKQSVLPFMMLKAIQELKAINDTQAETINALTARIVALESRGTV